nr:reverse transcriptase domain-containing protein [Tanacetum cinerariifolium]
MQTLIQASMSKQTNKLKKMIASFFQMNNASTSGSGQLHSSTIANLKGELKAITTRSSLVLDGPSIPMPLPFINPEEDERQLHSSTIANLKGELKAITTRSGLVLDGPSIPMPLPFINPEEDERIEGTLTDLELVEYTIKVPPLLFQKAKPPSLRNYVVHQRNHHHPHIPYPLIINKENSKKKMKSKFISFGKCSNNFISISLLPML